MQVIRNSKKERNNKAAPLIFSIDWISFFPNHNRYLLRVKEWASGIIYTLEKEFFHKGRHKKLFIFYFKSKKTETPPPPPFLTTSVFLIRIF